MARMTQAYVAKATRSLARADPALGKWMARVGPIELRRGRRAFTSLCSAIISQQVSGAAARTISGRFRSLFEHQRPTPQGVLELSRPTMAAVGLSKQKISYLRATAEAFESKAVSPRRFRTMTDAQVIELLTEIRGIGTWTAEMFLLFVLGRPDIFSIGDLGLRAGVMRVCRRRDMAHAAIMRRADRWAPHRSVASLHLWKIAHWSDS